MNHNSIDVKLMRQIFYYEPELGQLFYRYDTDKRCKGDRAGYTSGKGYRRVLVNSVWHKEHRIIYAIVTGRDPGDLHVHHINGVRDDNSFHNLLALDPSEHIREHCKSTANTHPLERPVDKRNTSGISGVAWDKQREKWRIRVVIGGKVRRLGRYKDLGSVKARICEAWDEYQAGLLDV